MKKLTNWIKNYQIAAFFIITFAITWGLGFSYDAVLKQGQFLLAPLMVVAMCGPALAGIIITAMTNTQPKQENRKAFWIAFFVAWFVSVLVFVTHNTFISHVPLSLPVIISAFVVVAPVAFVISMTYSRIPLVRSYLSSLIRLHGVWRWALLALAWVPVLVLLSALISRFMGRHISVAPVFPAAGPALISLISVRFLYQLFFYNAVGEEVGWRGFALPRLQARTSPLIASLVIAFFWVPWHYFLWKAQGVAWNTELMTNNVLIVLSSIVTGWFYNRSKGSILVAGIIHAAENTYTKLLLNMDWNMYLVVKVVITLAVIMVDRMWKKLPSDHPAVFQYPRLEKSFSDSAMKEGIS